MAQDLTWHSGPPPHVGWWIASRHSNPNLWRWWDGSRWSAAVNQKASPKRAGERAKRHPRPILDVSIGPIKWNPGWPKNARVPRIDPRSPSTNSKKDN